MEVGGVERNNACLSHQMDFKVPPVERKTKLFGPTAPHARFLPDAEQGERKNKMLFKTFYNEKTESSQSSACKLARSGGSPFIISTREGNKRALLCTDKFRNELQLSHGTVLYGT